MKKVAVLSFMVMSFVYVNQGLALGFSPWTTVEKITQGPGENPLVKLASPGDAATGCTKSTALRFVDASTSSGKRQFSILLSAITSGKEVQIYTKTCSWDYPYIDHVYIRH